jgi:uncharacterized membrane protein HdeD (DUF308 family)
VTAVEIDAPRAPDVGKWWWLLLVTGILWIFVGLFVLAADFDSAVLIGYLVAFWLFFACIVEFIEVAAAPGWKWVHVIMGVILGLGGIAALLEPFQTFTILASLMGIFLVLKGTFDFAFGIAMRRELDLWWLTMSAGIAEILLGIWAMGYPGRSAALLVLWIGIGAIMRGVVEIATSFHVRKFPEEVVL